MYYFDDAYSIKQLHFVLMNIIISSSCYTVLCLFTDSLHKLEATCMNQEQSINELKRQLNSLKEKSSKLETELKLQEDNKEMLAADSQQQLQTQKQV